MSTRKVKSAPKSFESDATRLQALTVRTMTRVSEIVGSTLGPGGRNVLIESDYPGIPNKSTKDGVTVISSLGARAPYEQLIIEQARDAAKRTAQEAGDGTTTATVLSAAIIQNLFDYCKKNPKHSPQRVVRQIGAVMREKLLPMVRERAVRPGPGDRELLYQVARVSANGDREMADAVLAAFDLVGYSDSSHVTIKETSGPHGYSVEQIKGFPIPMGYEDSIGKFHTAFINDQANQRCFLEKPLFLLFDGTMSDLLPFKDALEAVGERYVSGDGEYKNVVVFAHGYSDSVLTHLAFNFSNPGTINVMPMVTPRTQQANSQLHFLNDLAAFTGARVYGLSRQMSEFSVEGLGRGMEYFECYRFRSTVVGDPDPGLVEMRAAELEAQLRAPESGADKILLQERLGKLTSGIAKLTISAGSNGELKEAHDRCEDAVCAVRSAVAHGAVPGGCRVAIDLAVWLMQNEPQGGPANEILAPSLMLLPERLLSNIGHSSEEINRVVEALVSDPGLVYDAEGERYGTPEETGLYDAARAVEQALENALSIAGVLGTMGGIVAYDRDDALERQEAAAEIEFQRAATRANEYVNEADLRP